MHKASKFQAAMKKTDSMKQRMMRIIKNESSEHSAMEKEEITLEDGRSAFLSL
jgi:hypothetical protein